jgi:Flp pilus assembly pilin Flp
VLEGNPRAPHRDRHDRGVTSVEYSLATVGVAGVLVAAVFGLGHHLADVFDCMSRQLSGPTATCAGLDDGGSSTDSPSDGPGATTTSDSDPAGTWTGDPTGSSSGSPSPSGSPSGSPSPSGTGSPSPSGTPTPTTAPTD